MKTQKKLEKLGIVKEKELEPKEINYIAHFMADSITNKVANIGAIILTFAGKIYNGEDPGGNAKIRHN